MFDVAANITELNEAAGGDFLTMADNWAQSIGFDNYDDYLTTEIKLYNTSQKKD